MGIQKQEFYEGAALHQLICRSNEIKGIVYASPFFVIDGSLQVYLKYSTGKRSPWGFTFTPDEQHLLQSSAQEVPLVIGLICGADGVAALPYEEYIKVAQVKNTALRVSCRRLHREHFEVGGPNGTLSRKVAPSDWSNLLMRRKEI